MRRRSPTASCKSVGGIGGEITTQYILRYKPDIDIDAKPRQYRRITVDIPGLPNVKISAREGYFPNEVPGLAPKTEAPKAPAPATPAKPAGGEK